MAKYGGNNTVIMFDNSGGTPVDMSQYVEEISELAVEAMLEESHTFGDSWREQLNAGLKFMPDITIKGKYDDTATTGPDAIFNAVGNTTTRTLTVTFGGSKTRAVETIIKKYGASPRRGRITTYEVVLAPTGTVTDA